MLRDPVALPGAAPPLAAPRAESLARSWAARVLLVLASALVAWRAYRLWAPELVMDDAFILFRYARNLADGFGPVFNAGERVEGYVTFLWVGLLALGRRLGFELGDVAVVLSFAATAATLWVLHLLGRRLFAEDGPAGAWKALVAPLLYATMANPARYVGSGMETNLVVLLSLAGLTLWLSGERRWAGLVFALATLTRPEMVLFFGLLMAYELLAGGGAWRERLRRAAVPAAVFAAVGVPYFLWRLQYFGYLLPNPFYVKVGSGGPELWVRGAKLLLQALRESSLEAPLALALVGLVAGRRRPLMRLLGAWILLAAAYFIAVGGDFLYLFGPRFLMPAVPVVLLLAAEGLGRLVGWLPRWGARARPALAALVLVALAANAWLWSWPVSRRADLRMVAAIQRGWIEVGKWLAAHSPPEAVLAVQPAGAIPYFADRVTIDMFGLSDLHIAHQSLPVGKGSAGHEKYDTAYVLSREPDFLVFMRLDAKGQPVLADWPRFGREIEAKYQLVALARGTPRPEPLPWVVEAGEVTAERLKTGYLVPIYRRRTAPGGDAAAGAATGAPGGTPHHEP
ncbi:MAG TPA: hypothetical protein VF017_01150 [Thermoanaerobaculia bacterium]|nr:hypothetical protein [Thermoanaerobaculia bacterium]